MRGQGQAIERTGPAGDSRDDAARCARSMREGSRSFNAAALLLPARVRQPARAVYAFCRAADDAVDRTADPLAAVAALRRRLDGIYRGDPQDRAEDRAFGRVARLHSIPRVVPQAMLEGFLWDAQGRSYHTGDDLLAYAARVAGTVGVMMAMMMGVRDRATFARACELGLAMQLTNIARDVGEDARNGRVYLPENWLEEEGLSAERLLAEPRHDRRLARVVRRTLALADIYYDSGMKGLAGLPVDCRVGIGAAALIYRSIGTRIEAADFDSVNRRAITSPATKLAMLAAALPLCVRVRGVPDTPAAAPFAFLVEAACASRPAIPLGFDAKVGRFIELLQISGRIGPEVQPGGWSLP